MKGEVKDRSLAHLRLHPDPPPMLFHDPFAESETEPGPGNGIPSVQPFKQNENLAEILRCDTDPIVLNCESPHALQGDRHDRDMDLRHHFLPPEFQGIINDVLEELDHSGAFGPDRGQGIMSDRRLCVSDHQLEICEGTGKDILHVSPLPRLLGRSHI